MFDKSQLKAALVEYKKSFIQTQWPKEKYKWEAVKGFQDNWDENSDDFDGMLKKALSQTGNLLASVNNFPAKMISVFAERAPEEVRPMFIELFDESKDVYERINSFKQNSDTLLERYGNGVANHYQNENAISTYLWLRYPDKYCIYKFSEIKKVSSKLKSKYSFKKGAYKDNIRNFLPFYDEICVELQQDEELKNMLASQITETCYSDPELRTLTIDVGFFISRYLNKDEDAPSTDEWCTADYSPALTVDDWEDLLNDSEVFTYSSLEIMKRMLDYGREATSSQLSEKYGGTINFYNEGSSSLAQRVAKKTGCEVIKDDNDNTKWWPILYKGKEARANESGIFVWRLRSELAEALEKKDLSNIPLYAEPKDDADKTTQGHQYWWLTASPKIWSFSDIKIGEEKSYTICNENGNKRRVYQNFLDAKVGDIVIGYESQPSQKVVALAEITRANDGKNIYFAKREGFSVPIEYTLLKGYQELAKMEFFVQPQGSLFKLTKDEFEFIMDIIRESNPRNLQETALPKYTKGDFLSQVFIKEKRYDLLTSLLRNKMNIILQGAPGVGKTFAAKRLAYSMMGVVDDSRIELVQFHQNYSYEDFIMGYRPDGAEFKLTDGIFYRFCKKAENNPEKDYFFIIDEINRGNMSKILGELMMLIEKDYRGTKATLAYSGMPFSVPENLYIIGMMNTADRSLAMIDYALRRRFSFFEMEPSFDSDGFENYQKSLANETFNKLIDQIKKLNGEIAKDKSLGRGFRIGHSYFCGCEKEECTNDWMTSIVEYDILPMLEEYWFDEPKPLLDWKNNLRGVLNDQ